LLAVPVTTAPEALRVAVAAVVLLVACLVMARWVVWQTRAVVAVVVALVLVAQVTTRQMQPQALVAQAVLTILGLLAVLVATEAHHPLLVLLAQTALVVAVAVEHLLQALRVELAELAEPVLNFPLLQEELQVLAAVVAVVAVALALPVLVALGRSVVATVVVAAVVAVVSLLQATAGMVRKAQSSLNTGTLLELSIGLVALALGM
jgi:hypothetical protein